MSTKIQFSRAGGPEVLEFKEVPLPQPGASEVRIQVKAIGINRAEAMWRIDDYIEPVNFPAGLGYEAAGIVDAVGAGVTGIKLGDRVNVIPSFSTNQYGTYGDQVIVPDYAVVPHPQMLSWEEAASVWMMFVTAYAALIDDAKIKAGDVVVIPAASSSVGLAAIQIARRAGAVAVALTRTDAKVAQLRDVGASHVIVTSTSDVVEEIRRISEGRGADMVFDPVGGADFAKLISSLGFLGKAYIYGALSPTPTALPVLEMIAKMTTVKAHNIWGVSGDAQRRKEAVEYVLSGLESGELKPIIDRVFTFEAMREAHQYLEQNGQFGKVVVSV